MTLIKSISGIRGTIGDNEGDYLSPLEISKFASAFGSFIIKRSGKSRPKIVIGKDARKSGEMLNQIISGTLLGCGIDVVNTGLASTPTVEIAVTEEQADGGIIITASHNPANWNALKLLNEQGEFLSKIDGDEVLKIAENQNFIFADVNGIGKSSFNGGYTEFHIQKVLELDMVDKKAIEERDFTVAIDCVNSVGGICIPELLRALGVNKIIEINTLPDGNFSHNPEPLPENLIDLSSAMKVQKADVGFAVDPDVDRLAIICEDGSMFGEEYTLVSVADYILKNKPGNTVSNLSSTLALKDITQSHGGEYFASAVGEVNVVEKMKEVNAIIGGEGNGGVIFPELHYGRDALVGIALFLTFLAKTGNKCSDLRKTYPEYFISKNKIQLTKGIEIERIFSKIKETHKENKITDIDGIKIEFGNEWVHLRTSNTEPIIRIYAESNTAEKAEQLARRIIEEIKKAMN